MTPKPECATEEEIAEWEALAEKAKLESLYGAAGGNATSEFLRQRDEAIARADVAEKERDEWREHAEHDTESLDEAHDQLDECRAALDVAEAGLAEAVAWLGEIRSLRDAAMARADAAEAEAGRLREALIHIASGWELAPRIDYDSATYYAGVAHLCVREARAALAGGEKKGEGQ